MAIAALIVGIVAIVISIIALAGMAIAINAIIDQNFRSHMQTPTEKSENSAEFDRGYEVGTGGVWSAVQLAVFDMFREADIFDYEGTMENLSSKVSKVIKDEKHRTKLHSDLDEYMKRTENDADDSNDY